METMADSTWDLHKQIVEFNNSPEYQRLSRFYRQKSFFEVLSVQRNENVHSNFLAWLLDPHEFHGLGNTSLQKLLEVCVLVLSKTRQKHPSFSPISFFDDLIANRCVFSNTYVSTEKHISAYGRIDIYIETTVAIRDKEHRLLIIIENKVNSREHDSQTTKYRQWLAQAKSSDDMALLLYLTPLPTLRLIELEDPQCDCKDFLQINYQFLLDYLIEPAMERTTSERAKTLISDYIRTLSVCAITDDMQNNKGDLVMANSSTEKELLKAFWEQHQNLILAAFSAISSDPDQREETRDLAEKVIQTFSRKDKDYGRYTIFCKGKVFASDVVKTNVGYEVCRTLLELGLNPEEFELLRHNKSSSFELLKLEGEISESEKKYDRYRMGKQVPLVFEGAKYYASGNWGQNNIPNFQSFLSEYFPHIELRKQGAEQESSTDPGGV